MSISIKNVTKRYGQFNALSDVTLDMPSGALVALLGPSGSGKTTLLRIVAGLETADEGSVLYQEEDVTDRHARDRNVGFVFQHYALFRHMTVFDNIAFGLKVRKRDPAKIRERVMELLRLIRLEGCEKRYPSQLSGGQRQRVALARALAAEPGLILLDEPFGALDAKVRQELRGWLRRLHKELGVNCIFVTHDQEEAFEVADFVVIMHRGRIEQVGTPQEVFDHPANPFVMDFLGQVNVFHGRVVDGKAQLGNVSVDLPPTHNGKSETTPVYVRPHELDISRIDNDGALQARILHINPAGSVTKVQLMSTAFGMSINVDLPPERSAELGLRVGDEVYVAPRRVRVFLQPGVDYSI